MSKIADSVFELLVEGKSPAAARASVTSNSQFATGLQKYLEWSGPKVRTIQADIASLQNKQRELGASTTTLQTRHDELAQRIGALTQKQAELSENTQEQSSNLQGLQLKSGQADAGLKDIHTRRQELLGKGYTDAIISRLSASDAAHGGDMLSRVQSVERYEKEVQDQQAILEKQRAELGKAKEEWERLRVSSQATREELAKLSDRLRRRQDEERLFESSIKTVRSLMEGYALGNQDFQNMWGLVKRVGSPGMSGKTMENISAAVNGYRTMTKLEAAIKGKKETLDKVEADLGKAEERLNASTRAFAEASSRIKQLAEGVQAAVNETLEKTRGNTGEPREIGGVRHRDPEKSRLGSQRESGNTGGRCGQVSGTCGRSRQRKDSEYDRAVQCGLRGDTKGGGGGKGAAQGGARGVGQDQHQDRVLYA
jgi:predicted nuclease with TOPRIM domain